MNGGIYNGENKSHLRHILERVYMASVSHDMVTAVSHPRSHTTLVFALQTESNKLHFLIMRDIINYWIDLCKMCKMKTDFVHEIVPKTAEWLTGAMQDLSKWSQCLISDILTGMFTSYMLNVWEQFGTTRYADKEVVPHTRARKKSDFLTW